MLGIAAFRGLARIGRAQIAAIAVVALTCGFVAEAAAQTTIVLVRHAEKQLDTDDDDPSLTKAGRARAEALATTLRSMKLTAIYTTRYARTKETAAPTAKASGVRAKVLARGDFVDVLRRGESGESGKEQKDHEQGERKQREQPAKPKPRRILVVGHSNTVPRILRGLGVRERVRIADKDYDNLFVVRIAKDGSVSFLHLHYGARTG